MPHPNLVMFLLCKGWRSTAKPSIISATQVWAGKKDVQVSLCSPFSSSGDAEGLEQDPQRQQHQSNPAVCQYQGNSLSLALVPWLEPWLCTILRQELEMLESKAGLIINCNYFNSFWCLSSGFLRHILPWLSGALCSISACWQRERWACFEGFAFSLHCVPCQKAL